MEIKNYVIYENDLFLVINKPYGISVHPGAGNSENTIFNYLYEDKDFDCQNIKRYGIVHRLDKDTTGCMLISKDPMFTDFISKEIKNHNVIKKYYAICNINGLNNSIIKNHIDNVKNDINENEFDINNIETYKFDTISNYYNAKNGQIIIDKNWIIVSGWIERYNRKYMKFSLSSNSINSKTCVTAFKIKSIDSKNNIIFDTQILTGRTHQIRSTLKYLNIPILGDSFYNNKFSKKFKCRLCLQAYYLSFNINLNNINFNVKSINEIKNSNTQITWNKKIISFNFILQPSYRIPYI